MKTNKTTKAATFKTPHEKKHSTPAKPTPPKAVEAKPAEKPEAAKPRPARAGKLGELLGHSAVSVIRAMGKAGWDFDTAQAALNKAKCEAAEHTIRIGLKRGRDNDKTRFIAPVTVKQLNTLRA